MDFIDPHFHIWDFKTKVAGHNPSFLGSLAEKYPTYLPEDYLKDMAETGLKLKKAVFLEALSEKPIEEALWVKNQAQKFGIPLGIVARADLSKPNIDETLKTLSKIEGIRGIRQIMNYHPTDTTLIFPSVERDYFKSDDWKKGYSSLEKYNMSFDLHLNPSQYKEAADFLSGYPNIPVIIDHLGSPKLGRGFGQDAKTLQLWRDGMVALSLLKNTTMKISSLSYIKEGWDKDLETNTLLKDLVREIIVMFGSDRCMFTSNYPVDKVATGPSVLYGQFKSMVSDFSESEQKNLFFNTAERVYRL
eukprot:TRINITY_DN918_c0_g1_i5.p1 TRINITY_DN918_c0_g1~~TRINITY_DN918_c0_g1_i5.p1  ORF type:complete len:303 (-),score=65.75 TRINITY_DN918_c0_g1_i5:124-1032(-)